MNKTRLKLSAARSRQRPQDSAREGRSIRQFQTLSQPRLVSLAEENNFSTSCTPQTKATTHKSRMSAKLCFLRRSVPRSSIRDCSLRISIIPLHTFACRLFVLFLEEAYIALALLPHPPCIFFCLLLFYNKVFFKTRTIFGEHGSG
jgi:hypothetical protein